MLHTVVIPSTSTSTWNKNQYAYIWQTIGHVEPMYLLKWAILGMLFFASNKRIRGIILLGKI